MKNLKNLGTALSKVEQKMIKGGQFQAKKCKKSSDCDAGQYCSSFSGKCVDILLGS
ncbi:hypothetical protein [Lacinutrix cladophorae]